MNPMEETNNAMKFIITKTEMSLADLTGQVFDLKGSRPAGDPHQAQAALRGANPQFGNLAKLPAGTLVIVPDLPGVKAAPLPSLTGVSADGMAQLRQALAGAETVLKRTAASQAQEAATSLSLVKSRAVINLVKQTPALKPQFSQLAEQTKVQIKLAAADQAATLQGLAQLGKDLAGLNS